MPLQCPTIVRQTARFKLPAEVAADQRTVARPGQAGNGVDFVLLCAHVLTIQSRK